jgi:cell division septation protein DedD
MRRLAVSVSLLSVLALSAARAQGVPTSSGIAPAPGMPRPANDTLFRRARRLVGDGNGVAGRALVDSLLAAAAPGSTEYGNALYWHGALAPTAAEAERDYRRVIVEYPLAFYADDALLALAELEQARGDRAAALAHLQRFVHDHPASPGRGIAALGAARLAFEQRDTKTGCAMVSEAKASVAPGDVEVSNQIAYFARQCPDLPVTVAKIGSVKGPVTAPPASQPAAAPVPAVTAPATSVTVTPPPVTPTPATAAPVRPTPAPAPVTTTPAKPVTPPVAPARPVTDTPTVRPAAPTSGRYTIQLAAFNTRPEAEQFAAKLATRGLKTRVSGTAKPFRVRLGFYRTPQEASAEVAALKARGIVSFATTETPPPDGTSKP